MGGVYCIEVSRTYHCEVIYWGNVSWDLGLDQVGPDPESCCSRRADSCDLSYEGARINGTYGIRNVITF